MANEGELAEFIYSQLTATALLVNLFGAQPTMDNDQVVAAIESAITEFNNRDNKLDENFEQEEED